MSLKGKGGIPGQPNSVVTSSTNAMGEIEGHFEALKVRRPLVFNVQKYADEDKGGEHSLCWRAWHAAILAAEAAGGGIVQNPGGRELVFESGDPTLNIGSNIILDNGGHLIDLRATSKNNPFAFKGSLSTEYTISADVKEGDTILKATGAVQPAAGTRGLLTSNRVYDPEGNQSLYGEQVIFGEPDGALAGINGATSGGMKAGEKVTSIKIGFVGPVAFPASGNIKIGAETFGYTAVSAPSNVITFTLLEKTAESTHAQGSPVTLVVPEGELYLRRPVTQEGALANATGYTAGVNFAVGDQAKVQLISGVGNVAVRNMRFLGAGDGQEQTALVFEYCNNFVAQNVRVDECEYTGIRITTCAQGSVDNLRTSHTVQINYSSSGGNGYGVNVNTASEDIVISRHFHNRGRHAVTIGGSSAAGQTRRITVRDSWISNVGAAGIDSHGPGIDYTLDNVYIIGCSEGTAINCSQASLTNVRAILCTNGGISASSYSKFTTRYTFSKCRVYKCGGSGVAVTGVSGFSTKVTTTEKSTEAVLASIQYVEPGMPVTCANVPPLTVVKEIVSIAEKMVKLSAEATVTSEVACTIIRGGYNAQEVVISDGTRVQEPGGSNNAVQVASSGQGATLAYRYATVSITAAVIVGTNNEQSRCVAIYGCENVTCGNISCTNVHKNSGAVALRDSLGGTIQGITINFAEVGIGSGILAYTGTGGTVGMCGSFTMAINTFRRAGTGVELENTVTNCTINPNTYIECTTKYALGTGANNYAQRLIQTSRRATGEINASSTASVAVTFPQEWPDTNYTIQSSLVGGGGKLSIEEIEAPTKTGVTVKVHNSDASLKHSGTLHVVAVHD